MRPPPLLAARTTARLLFAKTSISPPISRRFSDFRPRGVRLPASMTAGAARVDNPTTDRSSSPAITSDAAPRLVRRLPILVEEGIEKAVYRCRFLAILAVCGSLVGSILCFIKGCTFVVASFQQYVVNRGQVVFLLLEAIDVYLLGTVMIVFGVGLYELFISNLDPCKLQSDEYIPYRSNLFGLFALKERPKWLEIKTVNGLKTKLGHVIVMLLLIGLCEKSKKAAIHTPVDLLCFSASVLLSSGCIYLLSKLKDSN